MKTIFSRFFFLFLIMGSWFFLDTTLCFSLDRFGSGFREERAGWIFVHIEGEPAERGLQYGVLMAPEINEFISVLKVYLKENTGKDWDFFRDAAQSFMMDKLGQEYQAEIAGIVGGMRLRGFSVDMPDIVAQNALFELADYYLPWVEGESDDRKRWGRRISPPFRCSAFIATTPYTKDGRIVMGHNSWDDYIIGQRFNVILDVHPSNGYRVILQCAPGFIHSGTDFAVNSGGMVITETTIGNFKGFDTNGIPEFIRARRAAQYSQNLDDFVRIMSKGNNGGYANTWLIGDIKTNEIGKLELGLLNVTFSRSKTGFYDGENYVDDSKMIREECGPTLWETLSNWPDLLANANCVTARRMRWHALMEQHKGEVDAQLAMAFEADQFEQALGRINPGGLVLMARMEITDIPEIPGAEAPRPFGANEAKVVTAELAEKMSFWARMGHPDGSQFQWFQFFMDYPQFAWQSPYLRNLVGHPWALFSSR